jgi:hypothetical protein
VLQLQHERDQSVGDMLSGDAKSPLLPLTTGHDKRFVAGAALTGGGAIWDMIFDGCHEEF